jgi:hypothetical protein
LHVSGYAQSPACVAHSPPLGAGSSLRRMYKKKLQLCTLGYAGRKIPSGENQNRYLMLFDDRHGFPALQAGAKRELCFYVRRRLEPAQSEVNQILVDGGLIS